MAKRALRAFKNVGVNVSWDNGAQSIVHQLISLPRHIIWRSTK